MSLFKKKNGALHSLTSLKRNIISEDTSSQIQEAYKSVRTNLQYALHPINGKVMAFTSAMPGEGKSTTAVNTAITFAQISKVLLIDADMRKPVIHKMFSLDNSHGLSLFLGGFESLADSLQRNVRPNLDIITSGTLPPNPSELLNSENMTVFLEKMQEFYDYIIIDTPPVNIVTDAVVLSGKVSGYVLIARQKSTTIKALQQTIEILQNVKGKILGSIITDVSSKYKSYSRYAGYRSYRYRYSRRYSSSYADYYRASDARRKSSRSGKSSYRD